MSDINDPWDTATDIRDYTDTDLQSSRDHTSRVYDGDGSVHAQITAYLERSELPNASAVVDRAIRVEMAAWIDSAGPTVSRDGYDVAYTIPPEGWVETHTFETVDDASIPSPEDTEYRTEDPYINYSTPGVVDVMMGDAIDAGAYETEGAIATAGLKRLLGHT